MLLDILDGVHCEQAPASKVVAFTELREDHEVLVDREVAWYLVACLIHELQFVLEDSLVIFLVLEDLWVLLPIVHFRPHPLAGYFARPLLDSPHRQLLRANQAAALLDDG